MENAVPPGRKVRNTRKHTEPRPELEDRGNLGLEEFFDAVGG